MKYPRRPIPWHVELRALLLTPLSGKEIAFQMGITHGTLKIYAKNLYAKLGIDNRIELMANQIKWLAANA
jgi:DNA-binding NarL/FixJ family response regulator